MKHVTASDARQNWFQILDEAASGKTIAISRGGKRLILRVEQQKKKKTPSYKGLIAGTELDAADEWGWDWSESAGLKPVSRK